MARSGHIVQHNDGRCGLNAARVIPALYDTWRGEGEVARSGRLCFRHAGFQGPQWPARSVAAAHIEAVIARPRADSLVLRVGLGKLCRCRRVSGHRDAELAARCRTTLA